MTCEGCGLPDDVCPGMDLRVITKTRPGELPANRPRDKTARVWVCGQFCAWQILAIAALGRDTSKWPIRLKEFISANPHLLERSLVGQTVTKWGAQVVENERSFRGEKARLIYQYGEPNFVTQNRGRKRKFRNNADRQRAYRQRE